MFEFAFSFGYCLSIFYEYVIYWWIKWKVVIIFTTYRMYDIWKQIIQSSMRNKFRFLATWMILIIHIKYTINEWRVMKRVLSHYRGYLIFCSVLIVLIFFLYIINWTNYVVQMLYTKCTLSNNSMQVFSNVISQKTRQV